jgi:hypothetical protein
VQLGGVCPDRSIVHVSAKIPIVETLVTMLVPLKCITVC